MEPFVLYTFACTMAGIVSAGTIAILRRVASAKLADKPDNQLKCHTRTAVTAGGSGILAGLIVSLVLVRLCTQFPTGTLHNLRGILLGSLLIFSMGLLDDFTKPLGLPIWLKLLLQVAATGALVYYDVCIHLFSVPWLDYPLTFLWVVGLTNAFNLLDIMDGLCVSQAIVCLLGLVFITLPAEYVYVNFAALTTLGACVAFWPYNYHKRSPVFLGDSGSNLLGFIIAALSMGADYSTHWDWGFLAPLLIAAVPIFDTSFVVLARLLKRKNPLKGSNDHAALRLKYNGWKPSSIVTMFILAGLICNLLARCLVHGNLTTAALIFASLTAGSVAATCYLLRLKVP